MSSVCLLEPFYGCGDSWPTRHLEVAGVGSLTTWRGASVAPTDSRPFCALTRPSQRKRWGSPKRLSGVETVDPLQGRAIVGMPSAGLGLAKVNHALLLLRKMIDGQSEL